MNGEPYTVIGVAAPGLNDRFQAQLWVPLAFMPEQINHDTRWLLVMGRLKDGFTQAQAHAEMQEIARQLATRVDLGIKPDHVLTFFLPVPESRFPQVERINPYYQQMLEKIESVPGVEKAAVTTGIPTRGTGFGRRVTIAGAPPVDAAARPRAGFQMVTSGYFETFGISVLKGRSFSEQDTATSTRVAMVNENFVNRFFSGIDPLGASDHR